MPKQICIACANEVLISYHLRKKAISSEKIMQNMIQRHEQENKVQSKDIENCKSLYGCIIIDLLNNITHFFPVNSTIIQGIGSCGNVCDQCINTGCQSMSVSTKSTTGEFLSTEASVMRIVDTSCKFCGNEQDTCNICSLDEEKPDICTLEVTSISSTENLETQTNNETVSIPKSLAEASILGATNSYKCNECEKIFATKSKLKKHVMTHTPDKPHHCKNCKW